MFRLFISLFLMVLASFLLFIGFGVVVDTVADSIGPNADIEKRISRGTFDLLDESLKGQHKENYHVFVQKHQNVFGPEFDLIDQSLIKFDADQKHAIENNEIVYVEDTYNLDLSPDDETDTSKDELYSLIFRKHSESSLIWRVHLDIETDLSLDGFTSSLTIDGGRFVDGMFYVLKQKLLKDDSKEIMDTIESIIPTYGVPIGLLNQNQLRQLFEEKPDLETLFEQNKTINTSQNTNHATFIQFLENKAQALQIGPIEIPWFIRNALSIMLFVFVFSVATALFIWVRPLWSNLLKIQKAATEFGEGNYSTRIPFKKHSAIAPVANAFNAMAKRTQQSITTQKELTTAVSHELRTPVARMRFALEMLESTDKEEDKKRYLESINEDIDDLDLLLEELLSYARFDRENTKLNLHLEKLTPWLSNSINKLIPLAKDKSLNYQIEGIGINESAYFEPRLMSRVLDNLVQNALRYASSTIEVTLSKDIEHYVLTVEDDGKGISKEDQKHIFDAFSRIDSSRNRATGGFGLGLAIVDRIIKAHQGSIEIKKSNMGGALFEARWPINHELIEYLKMPPPYF